MPSKKDPIKFLIVLFTVMTSVLLLIKLNSEKLNIASWNFDIITYGAISIFILVSLLYNFFTSQQYRSKFIPFFAWLGIFFVVIIGYAFRFEVNYASQRVLAVLVPSYSWLDKDGEVVISRNNDGHFYLEVLINNKPVKFMIDTGASDIALTEQAAELLNIDLTKLNYNRKYFTANGVSFAAPVKLNKLQIGNKVFENIEATISKEGALDTPLLGMSLIQRFKSFKIDKDLLILSY